MAKSTCSLASPASCASSSCSATSPASSICSVSSPASMSSVSSSRDSSLAGEKTKLGLKSSSAIDRRKRLAANARERKRMHLLNKAYDGLRRRLVDAENKSKYDVLVQAKEYIQALATIRDKLDQQDSQVAGQHQQQLPTTTTLTLATPNDQPANQEMIIQNHKPSSSSSAPDVIKFQASPVDMTYNQIQHLNQQWQHEHYNKQHHYHLEQDTKHQFVHHQKSSPIQLYHQQLTQNTMSFTT